MTQIQLIDLCSRVPYHPKGHVVNACNGAECDEWLTCATFPMFTSITNNSRLYLRRMSSMTEEEKEKCNGSIICYNEFEGNSTLFDTEGLDYLNKNMFDYRGLIEKGLALEAPEDMY